MVIRTEGTVFVKPKARGLRALPKSAALCVAAVFAGVLVGCVTLKDAPNMAPLNVSWEWKPSDNCTKQSPAFTIASIPADTKTLDFKMVDLDVPSFNHGGGTVAYSGSGSIPAGAFLYTGPCPPSGVHRYEFTVTAINAAGDTALGRGKAVRTFPPR